MNDVGSQIDYATRHVPGKWTRPQSQASLQSSAGPFTHEVEYDAVPLQHRIPPAGLHYGDIDTRAHRGLSERRLGPPRRERGLGITVHGIQVAPNLDDARRFPAGGSVQSPSSVQWWSTRTGAYLHGVGGAPGSSGDSST